MHATPVALQRNKNLGFWLDILGGSMSLRVSYFSKYVCLWGKQKLYKQAS